MGLGQAVPTQQAEEILSHNKRRLILHWMNEAYHFGSHTPPDPLPTSFITYFTSSPFLSPVHHGRGQEISYYDLDKLIPEEQKQPLIYDYWRTEKKKKQDTVKLAWFTKCKFLI